MEPANDEGLQHDAADIITVDDNYDRKNRASLSILDIVENYNL